MIQVMCSHVHALCMITLCGGGHMHVTCDATLILSRFCFASGAPDNIKIWRFPEGNFMQNFSGHQAIVNTVSINSDNVLVSGGVCWDAYGAQIAYFATLYHGFGDSVKI